VTSRDWTRVAEFVEDEWPLECAGCRIVDGPAPDEDEGPMGIDEGGREEGNDGREAEEGGLIGCAEGEGRADIDEALEECWKGGGPAIRDTLPPPEGGLRRIGS